MTYIVFSKFSGYEVKEQFDTYTLIDLFYI